MRRLPAGAKNPVSTRAAELAALADLLNGAKNVTLLVGSGVAGAHDEVICTGGDAAGAARPRAARQGLC